MSLLFTLLHAHRRAPASLLPVLSLSPRNISITVHTHLLDEASFSRSDPLPPPCPLARPLSLALVLSYRSESRSFSPVLPAAVPFFQRLLLRLSCSLAAIRPQHLCVRHSLLLLSSHSRSVPSRLPVSPFSHHLSLPLSFSLFFTDFADSF